MVVRTSGFPRQPNDTYVTPQWVWDRLYSAEEWTQQAWDCAPINPTFDFLDENYFPPNDWLATNPPFSIADAFCQKAINVADKVAMLLPNEFDTAKCRTALFTNPPFKIKYVITKRIRWTNLPQRENGPKKNHAWYIWDRDYGGSPLLWWI